MDAQPAQHVEPEYRVSRDAEKPLPFLERHPWMLFAIAVLAFLPAVLYSSQKKLLWHDELFTYYIAQAPTMPAMLHLTQTFDLNPPLNYILVRALFHVLPNTPTVCRIPAMAGFVLAMGCLFFWISKRFGGAWGVSSALLLVTGAALQYALEARPYGLELGFISLGFFGWQRAIDRPGKQNLALILVLLGGSCALLSHVFAIFAWGILILAEVIRIRLVGKVNWLLLGALLLPLVAVVTYIPLVRSHEAAYFPPAFQASLLGIGSFYSDYFAPLLMPLIWGAVLAAIFVAKPVIRPNRPMFAGKPAILALLGFFFVPLVLTAYLSYAHGAFFPRYGIVAAIGIAGLIATLGGWLTGGRRSVAWLITFALFVGSPLLGGVFLLASHPELLSLSHRERKVCEACELANRFNPNLPLVDASGLTFLEMDSRLDSPFLAKVFYLTDPEASIRYAHANIFEGMAKEKEVFPIRANVQAYSTFVKQHRKFLVFGTYDFPEDWLLRKLNADGAQLRLIGTVDDPQFKDMQVWQIDSENANVSSNL